MGTPFVGTIHPCKIYNALAVGAPILYLGPEPSHVSDILRGTATPSPHLSVRHGESHRLVELVLQNSRERQRLAAAEIVRTAAMCSRSTLLPRLVAVVEKPGRASV
jgi:colanic acid biosynthesis glycosyl transferase WcaI